MKKLLMLFAVSLWIGLGYGQTIRVVNNNVNAPTGPNVYKTLQAAVDASSPRDIIHVMPSITEYTEEVIIAKQLTVYGIGFYPDKDIRQTARVKRIMLQSDKASGTKISGLEITSEVKLTLPTTPVAISYTQSNISIEKCKLGGIDHVSNDVNTVNGLVIKNCIIEGTINLSSSATLSNAIITNNIISGYLTAGNRTQISNNIFFGSGGGNGEIFVVLRDCQVMNNIFYGKSARVPSYGTSERNAFYNNISYGTLANDFPPPGMSNTADKNLPGVDPQFVNLPLSNSYSFNYDPHLKPTAPGINAGTDGTDIGLFGGTTPFEMTGGSLPLIQKLNTSLIVPLGTKLNIRIKAKAQ